MSNEYELTYIAPKMSGVGLAKETVSGSSEQTARDLLRSKFAGQEIKIISGRQTRFGERDDRRDGKR